MGTHMLDAAVAPSVDPTGAGTGARISIDAQPDAFGAGVARAREGMGQAIGQIGASAFKVADFYSQVAGDDAYNNLQDHATKLLHGDPTRPRMGPDGQPVMGPDGKPAPDTGFLGLKGEDASRAWPDVQKNLDAKMKEIRSGLTTPEQQLKFDQDSRRLRSMVLEKIGAHADSQFNVYATSTASAAATNALNSIGLNADDPMMVDYQTEQLRHAYAKQAQLSGGGKEAIDEATARADRDALSARVQMIAVKDPARAQKLLDDNKDTAGPDYPKLSDHLRSRADEAIGNGAADRALGSAKSSLPTFAQAAPGANGIGLTNTPYRGPLDKPAGPGHVAPMDHYAFLKSKGATDNEALMLTGAAASESNLRPTARHDPDKQTGVYAGYGMYGHNTGRLDLRGKGWQDQATAALTELRSRPEGAMVNAAKTPQQLADAQMHFEQPMNYTRGNPRAGLNYTGRYNTISYFAQMANGSMPTGSGPGGVYGGEGGQMRVMPGYLSGSNPGGGQPSLADRPAAAPPTLQTGAIAEGNLRASAYAAVMADPSLNDNQRQHALARVNQTIQSEMIANEADTKARQINKETAIHDYLGVAQQIKDPADAEKLVAAIRADHRLVGESAFSLEQTVRSTLGMENTAGYGRGWAKAFERIVAQDGDPAKLADPDEVLRMEQRGEITGKGARDLISKMREMRQPDQAAVHTSSSAFIAEANKRLSFDQETSNIPGFKPFSDSDGRTAFNTIFISKWERGLAEAQKKGAVWQYLTRENFEKTVAGIRDPRQMAVDRVAAENESINQGVAEGKEFKDTIPQPPLTVEPDKWAAAIADTPAAWNGRPMTHYAWGQILESLAKDPSKENVAKWRSVPSLKPFGIDFDKAIGLLGVNKGATPGQFAGEVEKGRPFTPETLQERQDKQAAKRRAETWGGIKDAVIDNFTKPGRAMTVWD